MHRHVTEASFLKPYTFSSLLLLPAHVLLLWADFLTQADFPVKALCSLNGPCTRHVENVAGEQVGSSRP